MSLPLSIAVVGLGCLVLGFALGVDATWVWLLRNSKPQRANTEEVWYV